MLSQEHPPVSSGNSGGVEPATSAFTEPHASRYTTNTIRRPRRQRNERESNPQGLAAHSLSKRAPSPIGWPFLFRGQRSEVRGQQKHL